MATTRPGDRWRPAADKPRTQGQPQRWGAPRVREEAPPEFEPAPADMAVGTRVSLTVQRLTPLGALVLVDERYSGLVYQSELFSEILVGQMLVGYVRQVRTDGKLDISLKPGGSQSRDEDTERLLEALELAGGFLPLHDKSTPEEIASSLQLSKKAFKRALGILYRERQVVISDDGVRLVDPPR
jgi:uncharacterized protein